MFFFFFKWCQYESQGDRRAQIHKQNPFSRLCLHCGNSSSLELDWSLREALSMYFQKKKRLYDFSVWSSLLSMCFWGDFTANTPPCRPWAAHTPQATHPSCHTPHMPHMSSMGQDMTKVSSVDAKQKGRLQLQQLLPDRKSSASYYVPDSFLVKKLNFATAEEDPSYTAKFSYPTTCMGTWMFSQTRPRPSRPGSWDRITRYVSMWRSQCCGSASPFLSCFPFRNICRLKAWKYATKSLTAGSETFLLKCQKLELRKSVTANLGCQIDWISNQGNENQLGVSVRDCLYQFNWNLKDHPKGGRWGKRKYKRERLLPVVFILCWQAHLLAWHLAVGAAAAFFSLTLEPSFIGPPR